MEANAEIDRNQAAATREWWQTSITDIQPGIIRLRGYPVEDLIGRVSFVEMAWLMLRGELPDQNRAKLLEAALVASVDHGPHAPSIAIARMAATCGIGINGAIASAVNALGDVHGGAGQQAMELYAAVEAATRDGLSIRDAVAQVLEEHVVVAGRHVPGFGHRFHPIDPRAPRLLALVEQARRANVVEGRIASIAMAVEDWLADHKGGRRLPMNVDGVTAVVYAELGFPPVLGRALFVLSRSIGIMSHAWEQMQEGRRIKGPIPPTVPHAYVGPLPRGLEDGVE